MTTLAQQKFIRFVTHGQGSHIFQSPEPLFLWFAPETAGLYAILVLDPASEAMPYRVIYFGETGNFADRGFPTGHEKYQDWFDHSHGLGAGLSGAGLYIAIKPMPYSAANSRKAIEQALIEHYQPVCNAQYKPLTGLRSQENNFNQRT